MAKYTRQELQVMAKEAMRAKNSAMPTDVVNVMLLTMVIHERTGLGSDEIWWRIERMAEGLSP